MIDAKHVHKLLECKYDFKHWIKDVISSFNFKDGIDYISYRFVEKVFYMENKEDYVGYEDQELCNRYYKEAEAMRQKQDWSRLRAVPAPAKGTPSPGWGQLGRGNDVRVKYVSINSGLGGDRL